MKIEQLDIKITDSSFAKCLGNLEKIYDGTDILRVIPVLAEWVEFTSWEGKYPRGSEKKMTNSNIIRYIICMYDPNSPFVTKGISYDDRKICSAEYCKFPWDTESGLFDSSFQQIMSGKLQIVLKMIVRYCSIVRGLEYATYRLTERNYYENTISEDPLDITKIQKETKFLNEYKDIILAGDSTKEVSNQFYKMVAEEELQLRQLRPEYKAIHFQEKFPKYMAE